MGTGIGAKTGGGPSPIQLKLKSRVALLIAVANGSGASEVGPTEASPAKREAFAAAMFRIVADAVGRVAMSTADPSHKGLVTVPGAIIAAVTPAAQASANFDIHELSETGAIDIIAEIIAASPNVNIPGDPVGPACN